MKIGRTLSTTTITRSGLLIRYDVDLLFAGGACGRKKEARWQGGGLCLHRREIAREVQKPPEPIRAPDFNKTESKNQKSTNKKFDDWRLINAIISDHSAYH